VNMTASTDNKHRCASKNAKLNNDERSLHSLHPMPKPYKAWSPFLFLLRPAAPGAAAPASRPSAASSAATRLAGSAADPRTGPGGLADRHARRLAPD
jgi:hypothetical protein